MTALKLLIAEDSDKDLKVCRDSIARYKDENSCEIDLVECKNVDEAFKELNNTFDGAIIDLKLADAGGEGNRITERISEFNYRIPIAILTGTPASADTNFSYIGVFKKGEIQYTEILDSLWGIYNTGLTRIMGGRGKIEETLNKVLSKNILPQKEAWISHGKIDSGRTERALLRHTLNHLLQLLDKDEDNFFPEEVYIFPPFSNVLRTGSIVKSKEQELLYVVLSPACDLVVDEQGIPRTDRILLVEIEKRDIILYSIMNGITASEKKKKKLKEVFGNNHTFYYHWLPSTDFFEGGFLNFRKLIALSKEQFHEKFNPPTGLISPSFVKDIVGRFSTYYARQGQPNIDCEKIISHLVTPAE
jgi:hypothetical protein